VRAQADLPCRRLAVKNGSVRVHQALTRRSRCRSGANGEPWWLLAARASIESRAGVRDLDALVRISGFTRRVEVSWLFRQI
jgi:hypothetical protein